MPIVLPLDTMFSIANSLTLLAWLCLVALPRWPALRRIIQAYIVAGLCTLYAALIQGFFFAAQGGGFFSLPAVQQLFTSREVALAGWLHYLAFDLFVGLWIAQRGDEIGLSRWLQAPVLLTTFMFGPIGLFIFAGVLAARRALAWRSA